ncbi:MAG: CoA transferase [Microbacterium sp.]
MGTAEWTSRRAASDVAAQLQSVGVPAARMQHVRDLPRDPHLLARQFFRTMTQPGVEGEVLMERGLAVARHLTDRSDRPAPFYGQHTREVCCEVLGLDDAAVDALVHEAALDELSERDATILHAAPAATVVFPNPDAPV